MSASRKSKRGHSTDLSAQQVHVRREFADQQIQAAVIEALEGRWLLNAVNFASAVPFNLTAAPTSVVIADYNGDGKPDLISANYNGTISLLQGNKDGTFQPPVNKSDGLTSGTAFLVAASLTTQHNPANTVLQDLVVASQKGSNISVLLATGGNTFNQPVSYVATTGGADVYSIAKADVNGDGQPDIITGNTDHSISILTGVSDGTFQAEINFPVPNSTGSITVAAGQLSSNGAQLVAAADNQNNTVTLLEFYKSTTPTVLGQFPTGMNSDAVAVGDLNKDGIPDVVVGSEDGSVTVIVSNSDGTYKVLPRIQIGSNVDSVAIADMDGDGNPDIIVGGNTSSATNGGVMILFGNGSGSFANTSATAQVVGTSNNSPRAVVGALTGDGRPDLVNTNAAVNNLSVRLNMASGTTGTGVPVFSNTGGVVSALGTPSADTANISVYSGTLVITIDSTTQSFPLSSVSSIYVNMGVGNDSIVIEAGVPAVFAQGGAGNDTIIAQNNAADTLAGGRGKDSILGGGAETLPGGGNMLLEGGRGADTIVAGSGNSTVLGGGGSDSLTGGSGNSLIEGGNGNDSLLAGSGASTLIGGAGNDSITGSTGANLIRGGQGNDTLVAGAAVLVPAGFANTNTLIGGGGFDLLVGSGGGSDLLRGGPGNDTIVGAITALGIDTIYGGNGGFDSIQGGNRDSIQSAPGDTITRNGVG